MNATGEISIGERVFMLRDDESSGEQFEMTLHEDGGITVATAYRQSDFCNVTQASLTREQAAKMLSWLSRSLAAPPV
jgi:hypothetical protein